MVEEGFGAVVLDDLVFSRHKHHQRLIINLGINSNILDTFKHAIENATRGESERRLTGMMLQMNHVVHIV